MDQPIQHNGATCKCPHHKMGPGMVLLIALAFLLQALGVLSAGTVSIVWPILLGIAALSKMMQGTCKCC